MVDPISRDENGSVLKAHLTTALDFDSLPPRSIERTSRVSVGGRVEETSGEGRSMAQKHPRPTFCNSPASGLNTRDQFVQRVNLKRTR